MQPAAHEGSPFSTGVSCDERVCAWCLQHVVLRFCLQHDIEHCDVFSCANAAREGPAAMAVSSRTASSCSTKRTKLRLDTIADLHSTGELALRKDLSLSDGVTALNCDYLVFRDEMKHSLCRDIVRAGDRTANPDPVNFRGELSLRVP